MAEFKLLPQSSCVEALLQAAIKALPSLPEAARVELEARILKFEGVVVPPEWRKGDFNDYLGEASEEDVLGAMRFFSNGYELNDFDWARVEAACDHYLQEQS